MFRHVWRGLLDRLEGFREGRAETLNGVSAEQFVMELNAPAPEIIDLRGKSLPEPARLPAPDVVMAAPPPRGRRSGRHRMPPQPAVVRFPATTEVIPRVVPACGTRPPWDTAEFAATPDEPVFTAPSPDIDPADFEAGLDAALAAPGSTPAPDDKDDLQQYLDALPGYPED